jgi:5-methylcytosine-specific restriction endonuclease McrA
VSGHLKTCHCGRRALPGTNRCALHPKPEQTAGERLERQPWRSAYASAVYRRNRQLAYELAGGACALCGAALGGHEFICDHVVALTDGGTNDIGNLQVLCHDCSRVKTREDRRARARQRA